MPVVLVLLLITAFIYHLGFRFEHWTGGPKSEITYERDNLTGQTHEIRPGEKVDFLARLLGKDKIIKRKKHKEGDKDEDQNEDNKRDPVTMSMIESPQKASPDKLAGNSATTRPTTEGSDFNGDGVKEQIVVSKILNDGLQDISVISNGRELFYGRGKKLTVLNSKTAGWADLSLETTDKRPILFQYRPTEEGYVAIESD